MITNIYLYDVLSSGIPLIDKYVFKRTAPQNVGYVVLGEGPEFKQSWLDQETNHLAVNDVVHVKVRAPYSHALRVEPLVQSEYSWDGEIRDGIATWTHCQFNTGNGTWGFHAVCLMWGSQTTTFDTIGTLEDKRWHVVETSVRYTDSGPITSTRDDYIPLGRSVDQDNDYVNLAGVSKERWLELAKFESGPDGPVTLNQLYQDAVQSVVIPTNNIANMVELAGLVKDVVQRNPRLIKDLKQFMRTERFVTIRFKDFDFKRFVKRYHLTDQEAVRLTAQLHNHEQMANVTAKTISLSKLRLGESFTWDKTKRSVATIGSFWLAYRYAYNTTKSDVEATWDYSLRYQTEVSEGLQPWKGKTLRSGKSSGDYTHHLSFQFADKGGSSISESANLLAQFASDFAAGLIAYGFSPSLYNFYDLIPMSFVVDWIVPIGDALEARQYDQLLALYRVKDACYSVRAEKTISLNGLPCTITSYERRALERIPTSELNWAECFSSSKSLKTKAMRLLDGLSILLGS